MELRDLHCVSVLAEELHFGRAATRLGMAQPPLSQRIRALEEELGVRLFERTSRHVALTPAGVALWSEARSVLAQVAKAADTTRRVAQGLAGQVTVGFVNPAMDAFLSDTLAAFRREAPDVVLTLREMSTPEQITALAGERIDIGFVRHVGQQMPGVVLTEVSRERYVLALPAGHALARKSKVPLAALHGREMIMPPRGNLPALGDAMHAAFAAAGVTPVTVQEAVSKFTTLSLVAAGVGLALLPASVRVWKRSGVVLRPIKGQLPEVLLAAAVPHGRHPGHPAVSRLLRLAAQAGEAVRGASGPYEGP